MQKIPKQITIDDLVFWVSGKRVEDIHNEKDLDDQIVHILVNYLPNIIYTGDSPPLDAEHIYFQDKKREPYDYSVYKSGVHKLANLDESKNILNKTIDVEKTIIQIAKGHRKILPEHLALVMAFEKVSEADLEKLINIFLSKPFFGRTSLPYKKINLSKSQHRISAWFNLLNTWIGFGEVNITEGEKLKITDDVKIELEEFKKHLEEINSFNGLSVPLPTKLFTQKAGQQNISAKPEVNEPAEEAGKPPEDNEKKRVSISGNPGYDRLNKIYDELLKALKPITKEIDININDDYELPEEFASTIKSKFRNINEILHNDNISELKRIKKDAEQLKVYEKICDSRSSAERNQPHFIAKQLLGNKLKVGIRTIEKWLSENKRSNLRKTSEV